MSATVITLIILGIIFIFVSYVFAEKLESSDKDEDDNGVIEIPSELSDEQKEKINKLVSDYMEESVEGRLSDIEAKFSEIVNQKTLALGDYAVTVNDEIERNHNEVMFLYSMLSDKQKEIMTIATMVDDYRKEIEAFVKANNVYDNQSQEEEALEEAIREIDENIDNEAPEEEVKEVDSSKDVILEMHKSGLSILEIAKHLGLGVGEVKLVVDLYQGVTK